MSVTTTLTPTTVRSIQSISTASFAAMCAGAGLGVNSSGQVGFSTTVSPQQYVGNEIFLDFDGSAIPDAATITGATLKANASSVGTDGIFTGNDRGDVVLSYDWGTSVDTGDWRTGSSLTEYAQRQTSYTVGSFVSFSDLNGGLKNAWGGKHFKLVVANHVQLTAGAIGSLANKNWTNTIGSWQLDVTYTLPAPIVTSVSPTALQASDGGDITITGSNFQQPGAGTTTVTVGGVSATNVHVVSDTSITCTVASATPDHKAVTVTNSNGSSSGTTFVFLVRVRDATVKLVKGGTVTGDDKADTSTDWPLSESAVDYGSAVDMWGTTLTADDVNADDFGFVLSATVSPESRAIGQYAEMTIYYSVPGLSDPASYLVALQVGTDKATATPEIYKLPRSGFTVGQDDSVVKAASDVTFWTPRMYSPSRMVFKTYRAVEFWCEMTPATNTPGLQVWASVEDGTFFQLLDSDGNAATISTTGPQRVFFPTTADAIGCYAQLKFVVPALSGVQVPVQPVIRDLAIKASLRPVKTQVVSARLVLGGGEFADRGSMQKTVARQREALLALLGPDAVPEPFRDPTTGESGYMELVKCAFSDAMVKGYEEPVEVADIQLRRNYYGD